MSTVRSMPTIPRPRGNAVPSARFKSSGRRRRWPAWVMVSVSILGIAIAVYASNTPLAETRLFVSIGAFAAVIIVGTVMLFIQRVLDVGVARLSGAPLISSFDVYDRIAFAILLIGSLANGVVIAMEVARH